MLSVLLAACSSTSPEEDDGAVSSDELDVVAEVDDEISRASWETLGLGVHAKTLGHAPGANVLIVYGGYTAQDLYVERWADEIVRAKGSSLGVGRLYAVRGPNQSGYANREIANSKIAADLGSGIAANASSIVVVAHSSGSFVATELLGMLRNARGGVPTNTIGKVSVFNLDGGGGLDRSTIQALDHAYWVYACDSVIGRCSHNADAMKSLGRAHASKGGVLKVNADRSGCSASSAGGLWCLHDTLITTRPHNPSHYDLRRDYTSFSGSRKVVTSYLDVLDANP